MLHTHRFIVCVMLCLLVSSAVTAANGSGENLIPNHSFEMGTDSEETPLEWAVFSRSDVAYFTLTTDRASSGSVALKLVDTVNNQSTGLRSAQIPAEPGRVYRAETDVWVEAGLAQFFLDFHDASGRRIEAKIERARASSDWQTIAVEAVAPEGTRSVTLILYSDIVNTGTVYFDNVRLFDVTPIPEPNAQQTVDVSAKNYAVPGTRMLPEQYIAPFDITVSEWERQPPALYPPLPVAPGPDIVVTGPLHVGFTSEGLLATLDFDRLRRGELGPDTRIMSDLHITVASAQSDGSPQVEELRYLEDESGYEVNNSYFTRRLARFADATGQSKRMDVYTELIDSSLFFYMFPRIYLREGETTSVTTTLHLPGSFRRLTHFEGDRRVHNDLTETLTLTLDESVTKPFLLFQKGGAQPGVALFLPIRPEVRAWYHEHYVAIDVPQVDVTIEPRPDGIDVTFHIEGLRATSDRPHTFDFYYWAFPLAGDPSVALYVLQGGIAPRLWSDTPTFNEPGVSGFWVEHWPNTGDARMFQALRYFPAEGYSFAQPDHFYKGHYMSMPQDAHVWGNQTANYKRLNFSGSTSAAGLVYDLAVRHLQLYLDKADEVGVPPFKATAAIWFEHFDGLSNYDLLQNFHFAQAPEFMVRTALNFIKTGKPSEEDTRAIADIVNRTLSLLDPSNTERVPTTVELADGSFWYNYFEMETQRVQEGLQDEPGFVNNVHITWLNVIADAANLNKLVGNDEAHAEWLHYFRKGVDGLIYIFNQDRAWADTDPNELHYGIHWPGPNANYAQYILSGWMPNIMAFAYEEVDGYRLDEMVGLFRKIMQGRWTTQPGYASSYNSAVNWLRSYLYPKDEAAPLTRVTVSGQLVASEAAVPSGALLVLEAEDNLSGVAQIEFALNDGDWTVYSGPFELPAGNVTLRVRATDYGGNVEDVQTLQLTAR